MVRPSRGHSQDAYWSRDNLLAKMVQVALLYRQDDTLDCILKNNNDPLPLGFFTGLATHIDPKEMPWSKLQERSVVSRKRRQIEFLLTLLSGWARRSKACGLFRITTRSWKN